MVQADICKYIILSDTDRKKGDLQYPHPNVVHLCFGPALTRPRVRLTLKIQFAGRGSGEGRVNRPRSRHCDRLKSRKPGHPSVPQRAALFARKGNAGSPLGVSWGFFVGQWKFPRRGRFVKLTNQLLRRMIFAAAALLLGAAPSRAQGAFHSSPASPVYREVTDETGRAVRIPQPVRRIVSLAPSLTETVYALAVQDLLVGDTEFCDYPPDAQKKTKVGGAINPSLEQIAALHPDLVLVTKGLNRLETVHALDNLGIPSYATDPHSVNDIIASSKKLADLLGVPDVGASVAAEMEHQLAALRQRLGSSPAERVLFVVWHQPLISVGKHTFIADALRYAGAVSIVDAEQDWPQISLEEAARLQPDYLVFAASHSEASPPGLEALSTLPGWRIMDAVSNRRYAVISDAVNRPAPRIVSAIEELARQLHPELFAEKPENLNERPAKDKMEKEKDKTEKPAQPPIQPPHSASLLLGTLQGNLPTPGGRACVR